MMRLYYDLASTTSRPVAHFVAAAGLDLERVSLSLANGEHHAAAFDGLLSVVRSQTVPAAT
jgi:hypothetical protein